jgi:serine/threonine-protein kinase
VVLRTSQDVPPASYRDRDTPAPRRRVSAARVAFSALFLGASITAAALVWVRFVTPQVFTPIVQSTATAVPSAAASSAAGAAGASPDEPRWAALIGEAQRRFTAGDAPGAQQKLQEVLGMGPQAAAIARIYAEQLKIAQEATGACRAVAFSRPRVATERRGERPAVRVTPRGMLVAWADDHEQKDHSHVYGVLLNESGKATGPVRDLTPEASDAQRPQLTAQSVDAERTVLLYWDRYGRDQGVRARFLDATGRIDPTNGQSRLVGAARPGDYWPSIDRGPTGYYVVWQDDRDKDKENDLFVRALSNDLDTVGPETRLTDYHVPAKSKNAAPRVRYPSVTVAANALLIAYRLEKDKEKEHLIMRMRVPLSDLEKNGLDESKDPNRESREFGDTKPVNEDKVAADAPAVACGTEGCFVVWHGDAGGAYAAAIDPNAGRVMWRKKFSDSRGGRPTLAVNSGQVAIAYYDYVREGSRDVPRLRLAFLSRDGVSAPSTLFRFTEATGNIPRPSLAPGQRKNEWAIAWQDTETSAKGAPSPEIYAARLLCK